MPGSRRRPPPRTVATIPAIYAAVGATWILLSDSFLAWLGVPAGILTRMQTAKGWAFVAVTALVLYGLLQGRDAAIERSAEALRDSEERLRRAVTDAPFPCSSTPKTTPSST